MKDRWDSSFEFWVLSFELMASLVDGDGLILVLFFYQIYTQLRPLGSTENMKFVGQ